MTLPRVSLFTILGLLAVAGFARADDESATSIRDEAGLFSPEARHQADEQIAQICDAYRLDIVLETVAAPPEDMRKQAAAMKKAGLVQYFKTWGAKQADAARVNGVHVLICVDPGYVQVTVRPESQDQAFTAYDARRLQSRLKFMKKGPENVKQRDATLVGALGQVRDELGYNLRPAFPWPVVGGAMAGALGLWVVLFFVRMRLQAGEPAESRRLGLTNGLLGGMFGSVASHWIYDTLFIAASHSTAEEPSSPSLVTNPQAVTTEEAVEPTLEQARAERMDLTARDHPVEETPRASAPTRF